MSRMLKMCLDVRPGVNPSVTSQHSSSMSLTNAIEHGFSRCPKQKTLKSGVSVAATRRITGSVVEERKQNLGCS